ncbi:MAG: hypothetical protein KGH59_04690, partial [Candidatus Micrarchaeota archaeon]|nr:hypothetical protein [Candidatus Micrarchaeota archaeon]
MDTSKVFNSLSSRQGDHCATSMQPVRGNPFYPSLSLRTRVAILRLILLLKCEPVLTGVIYGGAR